MLFVTGCATSRNVQFQEYADNQNFEFSQFTITAPKRTGYIPASELVIDTNHEVKGHIFIPDHKNNIYVELNMRKVDGEPFIDSFTDEYDGQRGLISTIFLSIIYGIFGADVPEDETTYTRNTYVLKPYVELGVSGWYDVK